MTVMAEPTAETAAESTAERSPGRLRPLLGWVAIVALVVVGAFVAMSVAARAPANEGSLDPESRNGVGALALAEILRDHGIEVSVFRSRAEARSALALVDGDATLVMGNPYTLTDAGLQSLVAAANRTVFLSSSSHLLNELDIGTSATGTSGLTDAGCDIEEFTKVGTIRPDRLFTPATGVTACFGSDEGAAVLVDESADARTAVVEGSKLFSNEYLADNGNAALALALLAQTDQVIWYVPNLADSDIAGKSIDTLGSLTPSWVTPAILLLLLAGVAAAIWRGQRFGPLVAETLPVTVRASETMHGRARLTAKASDSAHAALALRDGAQRRLARRLGLAVHATADEVADAASDRLHIPRGSLQALLASALPADDAALIDLARRLEELEAAVAAAHDTIRNAE